MSRPRKLTGVQESWALAAREDFTLREIAGVLGVSRATVIRTLRPAVRIECKVRYALRDSQVSA